MISGTARAVRGRRRDRPRARPAAGRGLWCGRGQPVLRAAAAADPGPRVWAYPTQRPGLLVTVTQVGYLVGLALLVPVGDLRERRGLISGTLLITAVGLGVRGRCPQLRRVRGRAGRRRADLRGGPDHRSDELLAVRRARTRPRGGHGDERPADRHPRRAHGQRPGRRRARAGEACSSSRPWPCWSWRRRCAAGCPGFRRPPSWITRGVLRSVIALVRAEPVLRQRMLLGAPGLRLLQRPVDLTGLPARRGSLPLRQRDHRAVRAGRRGRRGSGVGGRPAGRSGSGLPRQHCDHRHRAHQLGRSSPPGAAR